MVERNSICLSVVIPCLNEEESLPVFLEVVVPLLKGRFKDGSWELIFINDGSTDATEKIILDAGVRHPEIRGITLTRNFGHQSALFTGLADARGEIVAFVDADMQDPPDVLVQLISEVQEDRVDVAFGVRGDRDANWLMKQCYDGFYRMMNAISDHPWQIDAGDFCAMNRKAANFLLGFQESDVFLRGLRSWIGLRQAGIRYSRPKRDRGSSSYSLRRLIGLAMKGVTGFSTLPLRMASFFSMFFAFGCAASTVILVANRIFPAFTLFGYQIGASPGTTTLSILILLVSCAISFSLGIIGEYLAVLLIEVKRRPRALISHHIQNE